MKSIKRSFPIPALVLSEAERIAKENGVTVSFFVRQAIVEKLERMTGNSFYNPQWGERTDLPKYRARDVLSTDELLSLQKLKERARKK